MINFNIGDNIAIARMLGYDKIQVVLRGAYTQGSEADYIAPETDKTYAFNKTGDCLPLDETNYHQSWDAMMELLNFISDRGYQVDMQINPEYRVPYRCYISRQVTDTIAINSSVDSLFEAVYKTIVDFARWYVLPKNTYRMDENGVLQDVHTDERRPGDPIKERMGYR